MKLIHTCYRITDIDRSVAFYEALGFAEVSRIPIGDETINVFMNIPGDGVRPRLELTYKFGVGAYDLGNGYGHIALAVDDLDAVLARLAEHGIEPEESRYSIEEDGVALVRDPDGYEIEIWRRWSRPSLLDSIRARAALGTRIRRRRRMRAARGRRAPASGRS
jgi:lactoylglutathione lyase